MWEFIGYFMVSCPSVAIGHTVCACSLYLVIHYDKLSHVVKV